MCNEEKVENRICKIDENYDTSKIPSKPLHLNSSIGIYDIYDINEKDHLVTVYIYVSFYWIDPRLNVSNMTTE